MTTPTYVPILAPSGNYPAGAESWAGTAKRVALSGAEQAAGFVPNTPIDAQSVNWLLGVHGELLSTVLDAPSMNWLPQPAYVNADVISSTNPNRNEATDPAIFYSAHERLILKTPGGGTGVCFHSRRRGQGNSYDNGDTSPFTACADSGATAGAVILTQRELGFRIVAIDGSSGTVRKTDDYGATWSAAGTYGGLAGPICGGYFDSAWHAANAGTPKEIFSSSTLSGAWTQTTLSADANSYYRFVVADGIAAAFLPGTCTTDTQLLVKPLGGAWQVATVTGAGASSGWRGDYNPTTGITMIVDLTGRCYTSTDLLNWTLVYTEASGVYDIASHGRGFVLSCVTEDFSGAATIPHLKYLALNPSQAWAVTRIPWEAPNLSYSRFHLARHRGRVFAGRVYISSADRLEWWESDVNPSSLVTLA